MTYSNKYYSDIISEEQIKKWIDNNDYVYLNGDTGTGKSTLVFSKLIDYILTYTDKSIYVLSNRKLLTNQHRNEIKSRSIDIDHYNKYGYTVYDRLSIMTYQAFYSRKVKNDDFVLDVKCGAINPDNTVFICDECHYFLSDCWQNQTAQVLDIILQIQATTFFISATGNTTIDYINHISDKQIREENKICIYQSYSNITLKSIKDNSSKHTKIIEMIVDILDNTSDKVMIYINNAVKLCDIAKALKDKCNPDDIKLCYSENNRRKIDLPTEHLTAFTKDKKMNCRCILTTKITDNGIDIYDDNLKHVIIDLTETDTIIQAIGRKRTKTPLTVYINEQHATRLKDNISNYKNVLNKADLTTQQKRLNQFQYQKIIQDLELFRDNTAIKTIYERLKHTGIKLDSDDKQSELINYLDGCYSDNKPVNKDYLKSLLSDLGYKANQIDKINNALLNFDTTYYLTSKRQRVNGSNNPCFVWYVSDI